MLNKIKLHLGLIAFLVVSIFSVAHADEINEDSFEDSGTITQVHKAAKVIFVDGRRMQIGDSVLVTYKGKRSYLLNVAEEGMDINMSGIIESNGVYTITSAFIYPNSQ